MYGLRSNATAWWYSPGCPLEPKDGRSSSASIACVR